MRADELATLVTKKDLLELQYSLEESLRKILKENQRKEKFLTPRKFSELTGMAYSTVVQHCNYGLLKARQDRPGSSWQIDSSELDRYSDESVQNVS